MHLKIFLLALLLLSFNSSADSGSRQKAISGEHRSTQHKNRDIYRNPQSTLDFFAVEPSMTARLSHKNFTCISIASKAA
ncbi:hypothetical protein BMR06_00180 [Methylococcaceae bacterium HT5]|nr:hypothetical protein BMR06_00180 [Methylococcaceae bacterium HT5]